jgi:hypothetical protein
MRINEGFKDLLVLIGLILLPIILLGGINLYCAKMKAKAFNQVTGKNITWQQAIYLDLKVQEPVLNK